MRSKLYSFLFLLIPVILFAQSSKDRTIYLDSLFKETTLEDHKYYMIVKDYERKKSEYFITRYYFSGQIECKGNSESKDSFRKKGEIISYYENEIIKSTVFYNDNNPVGKYSYWYENGNKKLEGEFILSKENEETEKSKLKVLNFWDKNNIQTVTNGNGDFEDDDNFEGMGSFLVSVSNGKVKNGFKDGIWIGKNSKRNFTFTENYENGKFISGESIDSNNEKHFYTTIQKMPDYKYGINNFRSYVMRNFRVPEGPGNSGKIFATFTIDEFGKLNNPTIVRGIGFRADNEAIRVLSKSLDWIPAECRGIKVQCLFALPISVQSPQ